MACVRGERSCAGGLHYGRKRRRRAPSYLSIAERGHAYPMALYFMSIVLCLIVLLSLVGAYPTHRQAKAKTLSDGSKDQHSPEFLQPRGLPKPMSEEMMSRAVLLHRENPPKITDHMRRFMPRANEVSDKVLHERYLNEVGLPRIIARYEKLVQLQRAGDAAAVGAMGPKRGSVGNACRTRYELQAPIEPEVKITGRQRWLHRKINLSDHTRTQMVVQKIHTTEEEKLPWCVQEEDLVEKFVPMKLSTFLKGGPMPMSNSPNENKDKYGHNGFPYVDAYGFKKLAEFTYETNNRAFGNLPSPDVDAYLTTRFHNRSLVYWSLFGRDMIALEKHIHKFTGPFFLICAGTDFPNFPPWLLENKFVLRIFAPNVPTEIAGHPKIVNLPLGIRYTTSWRINTQRSSSSVIKPTKPLFASFATRDNIPRGKSRPPSERQLRRQAVVLSLSRHWNITENEVRDKRSEERYLTELLEHKMVVSPPGHGLDAYRTWEVLYLGRVPIVKTLMPQETYDNLPVVGVGEWDEITPEKLEKVWKAMQDLTYNFHKIWHPWWVRFILRECLAAVYEEE